MYYQITSKLLIFAFVLSIFLTLKTSAQNQEQVEILLLGVYHFDNPGLDKLNTEVDDYLSAKRQNEITEVNTILELFKADQLCIENRPERQVYHDSLYTLFKSGNLKLNDLETARNEIFQLGYNLGKAWNLDRLDCIDAEGYYFGNWADQVADSLGLDYYKDWKKDAILSHQGFNLFIQQNTILNNLRIMNDPELIMHNHSAYNSVYPKMILKNTSVKNKMKFENQKEEGKEEVYIRMNHNYPGPELTAEWYKRNIKIYSNIMAAQKAETKRILVIIGQGHVRILQHLFEDNPQYKVVNTDDYLFMGK